MKRQLLGILLVLSVSCSKEDSHPTDLSMDPVPCGDDSLSQSFTLTESSYEADAAIVKFGGDKTLYELEAPVDLRRNVLFDVCVDNANNAKLMRLTAQFDEPGLKVQYVIDDTATEIGFADDVIIVPRDQASISNLTAAVLGDVAGLEIIVLDEEKRGVAVISWIGKDGVPFVTATPVENGLPLSHKLVTGDLEQRAWIKSPN